MAEVHLTVSVAQMQCFVGKLINFPPRWFFLSEKTPVIAGTDAPDFQARGGLSAQGYSALKVLEALFDDPDIGAIVKNGAISVHQKNQVLDRARKLLSLFD